MTQLKYLATALLILVGCAAEPLTETDSELGLDPAASEPDQAGTTDDTAPTGAQSNAVTEDGLPPDSAADPRPGQGEPCPDRVCANNLTCMEYYGFAGERGGVLTSCEIPCGAADQCPSGQSCITIADGPGQVCRPVERS